MNFPRTFAAGLFSFALVMLFVAPSPTLAEVDRTPLKTLEADVTKHRVSGGFAECGSNTSLTRGSYRVKLKSIDVKYGSGQAVTPCVLLRINQADKYAYMTLNGIGDEKLLEVNSDEVTFSVFFAPGEPTYDDSGKATVEIYKSSDRTPLKTLEADVTKHRVSGGFAECGSNTSLTRGSYRVKLKSIDVKYGSGQAVTPCVLLRINQADKYAYMTLNGIGDEKLLEVNSDEVTFSVFFAPGEPTYDDSGKATVEIYRES